MLRRTTLVLTLVAAAASSSLAQTAKGTEILWDSYGVPHIYARDMPGAGYAFGWAQMESHANLVLRLYGQARGRSAEYWGAANEASDRWTRTMGVTANARRWYEQQDPEFRRYLDAFAEGMNAWAAKHPGEIADSVRVVLPVSAVDVIAHGQRVIVTSFVTDPARVEAQVKGWDRPDSKPGSNAWAIAPKKSASGNAMLLANPHLPWSDLFTWYEAQIVAPGINVSGASLVGIPVIAIGFNDQLGWTHTVNTHDGEDLYELTFSSAAGNGYLWNGAPRAFETRVETLSVKEPDGRLTSTPLTIRSSVHGPVVGDKPGRALALRVVGLDRPQAWRQWWDMGRSTNLAEFRRALGQMQIPMFTVMYADRDGHIMHLFGGLTPVRPRGGWNDWQGIINGDSSSTLWTKTHTLGELPVVVDPPSGWLQNANDPPWTTTLPLALDPATFPAYMAPRGMAFRPQRSAQLLSEAGKLTFEEMIARKHDTRMAVADRLVGELVAAAQESGNEPARRAAAVLSAWDRNADAESRGAVLFQAFYREWVRSVQGQRWAKPWSSSEPLTTPRGIANRQAAVTALATAAAAVEKRYGALDIAWGAVNRLRRDNVDLPANGGSGALGIFRVVEFTGDPEASRATAWAGDSYVAAIEFSTPIKARALIGYGNASQPGSPHRVDQMGHLSRKELRAVWRTREEVGRHLKLRETF